MCLFFCSHSIPLSNLHSYSDVRICCHCVQASFSFCSTVDNFLPAFIGCLESHDNNVVMAAVGSIPDLVLLCKGMQYSRATNSGHNEDNIYCSYRPHYCKLGGEVWCWPHSQDGKGETRGLHNPSWL